MKCSSSKSWLFQVISASLLGLLISGCVSGPSGRYAPALHTQNPPADQVSFWIGDSIAGSPSVRISLSEQRAYLYKGDLLVGVSLISSGREEHDTVTGKFRILEKDRDHRSSLFGDYVDANGNVIQKDVDTSKDAKPEGARYVGAKMPYFMRIVDGTGMHQGFLPGYPDSHGCIRMPAFMAAAFFRTVSIGTPVTIER